MPYLNHHDSWLYYEVHGNGPPVVLLHGVGGNHASWFHQVAAWRSEFTVVLIDARGFGKSTDAEVSGRSEFTNDLVAVLDELDLQRVSFVAQSMGAGTAIDFTCRFPERVSSLLIVDSLVGIQLPQPIASQMSEVQQAAGGLSQAQRVLGKSYLSRSPAMTELYLQIAGFNTYTVKTLSGVQTSYSPQQIVASGARIGFVVGDEDVLFPASIVSDVCKHFPQAELITLHGAGHSAYFEVPDAFNARVGAWLRKDTAAI
ncbi:alpha/beta hydrolase [Pandoraea sputorum]|uniref:alpha/beta fold hydrolase n=1 Tax=Pandoraea sputorum TaxID=93222 RepID=UPI001E464FD0|nr:alpha/beta hydrolase [Pandoraea sputorum]MCE4061333.1 alpha/beta hydrolase [Pandoraea sputorum]